jgi:hypothetical protein
MVWILIDRHFPYFGIFLKENYGGLEPKETLIGRSLLDVWLRWDAVHYMNIAKFGYPGVGTGDLNFPPLYPYMAFLLKSLTFNDVIIAGLLISTSATILTFVLLYKLVLETFDNRKLAEQTIIVMSIYPTSLFLVAPYTDALFLCLSVGFFLALRQKKWVIAGLIGFFAGLTRLQGILLVIPLIIEAIREKELVVRRINLRVILGSILCVSGYLSFTLWRASQNIPSLLKSYEKYSNIVFVDPLNGILLAIQQLVETRSILVATEILSIILFSFLIVWMIFRPEFWGQYGLMAYSFATLVLFMSKHSVSASALQSANRYVLSIFPAFIGLALLIIEMPKSVSKMYKSTSLILLMIATTLYALWIFIG